MTAKKLTPEERKARKEEKERKERREWLDRMHSLNESMGRPRYVTNPQVLLLLASVFQIDQERKKND